MTVGSYVLPKPRKLDRRRALAICPELGTHEDLYVISGQAGRRRSMVVHKVDRRTGRRLAMVVSE